MFEPENSCFSEYMVSASLIHTKRIGDDMRSPHLPNPKPNEKKRHYVAGLEPQTALTKNQTHNCIKKKQATDEQTYKQMDSIIA